jgi:hypothetical protein
MVCNWTIIVALLAVELLFFEVCILKVHAEQAKNIRDTQKHSIPNRDLS